MRRLRMAFRRLATVVTVLLLAVVPAAAQGPAPPPTPGMTYDYAGAHKDPATGANDPGTTTPNPGGGSTTTYKDGWTKTTEPDNSFGPGGTKETIKDGQGKAQEITKKDPKGTVRQHVLIVDGPPGTQTIYTENYDKNGTPIDQTREINKDGNKKKEEWDPKKGRYAAATSGMRFPPATALAIVGAILLIVGLATALVNAGGRAARRAPTATGDRLLWVGIALTAIGIAVQTIAGILGDR